MQCSRCQAESPIGAKFCQECGSALPRACPSCGQANAPSAKFCIECGAALRADAAPSADRRQATVLFADISGYTAQCARSDPEEIRAMLGRFFDAMDAVVEAHGGRVFDRAGDAVMAVFGAPIAHGNDAQHAVRAALAMHSSAATLPDCDGEPLRLHLGLASGEVVAAVISGGGKDKYSVTGDTVNLAARLDALAAPGDTVISDALHASVASIVDAQPGGTYAVKGFAAPVTVWRVLGLRQARVERLAFVGRQGELRQLVGALDAVRETGAGVTILVRGDAGIGKSRLVDEFRARARELGFEAPLGQVLDFGVGKGQDAIPTVLKALFGVGALDDEAARRAALQRAIERGWVLGDEALFANEWLDLAQPSALQAIFAAMDNATRLRRAGETLGAVLQRAAQMCPLLVGIEDVHWASADLLRHLAALTRAAASAPLILLLTSRIEGDPLDKAWRASTHGSALMTIDLAPLRAHEAQLLAGGLVEASSRFALQCIERAEGNPLFLEQLLRAAQGDEAAPVPPTIQSLVQGRMDRLNARDRSALQTAAVIGKRFALTDVRGVGADPALSCDELVAADLIRPEGADFLFAHALIQEAVYASTLKSRRRELHLAAARWFGDAEPVLQAEHLDRADDASAAQAYLHAARSQAARSRFDAALRLAERGGQLCASAAGPATATGCELALLRGEVLGEVGRSKESVVAFQAAVDLAASDAQRCRAWMGIAAGHRITGDFASAMRSLDEAQPIAERQALPVECSRIHHTRGNLYFAQGRAAECEAEHTLAMHCAEQAGDTDCQAQALSGLGDAQYALGHMRSALGFFRRCLALCEGKIRIAGANRCMVGHCLWYENELSAAIVEAQSTCDDALRFGIVPLQVFAHSSLSQFLTEAGRFDEAEPACAMALALARAAGSRRYESTMLLIAAELHLRRGDADHARRDLGLGLDLARQTGLGFIGAAMHARLARVATSAAQRRQALAEGDSLLRQSALLHSHLWFYRDAVEASLAAADWPQALRYADALEAVVAAEPLPWAGLIVERARAMAAHALDRGNATALERLRTVRDEVVANGFGWALAGIDAALAAG